MATPKPFLLITKELTEEEHAKLIDLIGERYVARHMPRILGSSDSVDLEIAFNKQGELVIAVEGKEIIGQRDLAINSKHNEVVNVDVNFVLTKKALGFNEV